MIDWFYSDPRTAGFVTGVTRGRQKILEGAKTIVDTSNRFRVVRDVVCDDFMQFESLLDVKQVRSRLAAACGASPSASLSIPVRGHGHPAASRAPSQEVAKTWAGARPLFAAR